MDESHIEHEDEPAWLENGQPIQEFLNGSEKSADLNKEDRRAEKPSWREMMKDPSKKLKMSKMIKMPKIDLSY